LRLLRRPHVRRRRLAAGQHPVAAVPAWHTDVRNGRRHYTGKGGGYTSTSATIRFRDEHGDKHEILWNGTYGRRYYERGKTVPVSFLPGQAKDAQITTTRRFWLSIVVPVVLGAVMLPVGALGAIGVLHY
jgi:hypothetical protein